MPAGQAKTDSTKTPLDASSHLPAGYGTERNRIHKARIREPTSIRSARSRSRDCSVRRQTTQAMRGFLPVPGIARELPERAVRGDRNQKPVERYQQRIRREVEPASPMRPQHCEV